MNDNTNEKPSKKEKELFSNLKLEYNRSKEKVWKSLMEKTEAPNEVIPMDTAKPVNTNNSINFIGMGIAASIVLFLSVGLFARFYSVNVTVGNGKFSTHVLPDGSKVTLNAGSFLEYAPYWWKIQRTLSLKGEAYFEVEKGSNFTVHSSKGSTSVLGTSFNILARHSEYQVYCTTGKVKVENKHAASVILTPGMFTKLEESGMLSAATPKKEASVLGWKMGKFVYNTTPLFKVIQDIERQYNVQIELDSSLASKLHYTGLFERSISAKSALEIICHSFDLSVEQKKDDLFVIIAL